MLLVAPVLASTVGATAGITVEPAAAAVAPATPAVQLRVVDVSPIVPQPSAGLRPISFFVDVTNLSSRPMSRIRLEAARGEPVTDQHQLDTVLAKPTSATADLPITATRAVQVSLAPGETARVTFRTTTGIPTTAGICQCRDSSVYPITFIARSASAAGTVTDLGRTTTYLPIFITRPKPVQVSWVWPLIDRPHRLDSDTVFTDDDLRRSVGTGGRLDHALAVAEAVGPRVPVTLALDPELLDELEVMAAGGYRVQSGRTTVAGRGQDVAQLWLDRLRTVLTDDKLVRIVTVPYADPDLETSGAARIGWANNLPRRMRARVADALAGQDPLRLAWPATGTMGRRTLDRIVTGGAAAVLLSSNAMRIRTDQSGVPRSLDVLSAASGRVTAAMTSPALAEDVESAVSVGGSGTAILPTLTAELAVRTAPTASGPRVAVLVAPRYVDAVPDAAVRTILNTSRSAFTAPVTLQDLLAQVTSTNRAVKSSASTTFPAQNVRTVRLVAHSVNPLKLMLVPTAASHQLLAELPQAAERLRSAAWRRGAQIKGGGPSAGRALAARLAAQVTGLLTGVRIVRPSSGSYTLASSNSPLPITVENRLDYAVVVRLSVVTKNGLPGYTAKEAVGQRIEPHSKSVIRIQSTVDRPGRIPVIAQLSAPDGTPLGRPIALFVRSTVLGAVGVGITIVAAAVLLLAVVVRLIRRLRARGTPAENGTAPAPAPVPEAAP